jgi:hypothetical protein
MTLQDLEHIFRFQLHPPEDETPAEVLNFMLFEGNNRIPKTVKSSELESILPMIDTFEFEGYNDRTPLFVKPDPNL